MASNAAEPAPSAKSAATLEIASQMLDVHAPHETVHTWKSFFIHIATIVVGLFIAVALEQGVELIHHRHQVAEMREALRLERDQNRRHFVEDTRFWRWETAELQNNLLVLKYLQRHPETPQEGLPGILAWNFFHADYDRASWEAANQTGITILMPRQEVGRDAVLYAFVQKIQLSSWETWLALNDAERYTLLDPDPTHLSAGSIADEITLTESALTKLYIKGVALQNLHASYPDFPDTVTPEELQRVRNPPDPRDTELLAHARALTETRLRAAGWYPDATLGTPNPPK